MYRFIIHFAKLQKKAITNCIARKTIHKKNAVVSFDSVFINLNSATTIEAVMRTKGRNSSGKRARSPKKF